MQMQIEIYSWRADSGTPESFHAKINKKNAILNYLQRKKNYVN